MQDDHPIKSAAFQEALQRYENSLQKDHKRADKLREMHLNHVVKDEEAFETDKQRKL